MQAVLQGHGVSQDKEIPVPPPQESSINYDQLYAAPSSKPATYVRFSQTVEECIGCQYDMTEDDEVFLKAYNAKLPVASQLSEDDFESIMDAFEETASSQTPYASVDKTVATYDQMLPELNTLDAAKVMPHAKDIYEYWKSRRQALGNGSLHPTLKFETHQDSDEMDPYVCFRRREVRQTRKTRARDVLSADKLKRLRRELEDGRQLIIISHERECVKRDLLNTDRRVFEKRAMVKEMKVRLNIKTDDEDLVNQKVSLFETTSTETQVLTALQPQRRKAPDPPAMRGPPGVVGLASRPDGRFAESNLELLDTKRAARDAELLADIQNKVLNHQHWNKNHVDLTAGPLKPVQGQRSQPSFRPAEAQYLMTPPASASLESSDDPTPMDLDAVVPSSIFKFVGVPQDRQDENTPKQSAAYRRRVGRLNRLWVDRRGVASLPKRSEESFFENSDRWKYDQDDSEDERTVYEVDPFDQRALKFRATIPLSAPHGDVRRQQQARAQLEAAVANGMTQGVLRPAFPQRPTHLPPPPQPQPQVTAS